MHPRMKRAQIEGGKGAKPPLLRTQACAAALCYCVCTVRVCVHARVSRVYIGACTLQSRDASSKKRRRLCSVLEPN